MTVEKLETEEACVPNQNDLPNQKTGVVREKARFHLQRCQKNTED